MDRFPMRELTSHERFLVMALEVAREPELGLLTNEEVLCVFGPRELMEGFANDPYYRRAEIIEHIANTNRLVAREFTPEEAAKIIDIALRTEVTDPDKIFDLVTAEELVRTQDQKRIWGLICSENRLTDETEECYDFVELLITKIFAEGLLGSNTALDIYHILGSKAFVNDRVPEDERVALLDDIMMAGEPLLRPSEPDSSSVTSQPRPYTAKSLIYHTSIARLVRNNPIEELVKILQTLAEAQGWAEPEAPEVEAGGIPPEALDSMPPEAPESDDDPELTLTPAPDGGEVVEVSLDDVDVVAEPSDGSGALELDLDPEVDEEDEQTTVAEVDGDLIERLRQGADNKPAPAGSGPPPLGKRPGPPELPEASDSSENES